MRYNGLMIGGPHAGEWFSNDSPTAEFVENGRVIRRPREIICVDYSEPVCTTYVHVSAGDLGAFWVPEGKTAAWAVRQLVEVYQEVQVAPADL